MSSAAEHYTIIAKTGRLPLSLKIKHLVTRHLGPVSFTLDNGEAISLSGVSGCGKSLLLRAIADLDPHEGEVQLNNNRCDTLRASEWRRQVGYLPATSQWWGDAVQIHFGSSPFGSSPESPSLISGLTALGLDVTILSQPTTTLSSGERQRLALLRLLENRPQVLLLDEPTASLDPDSATRVETLIADYRRQHHCSVIWVSHDPQQRQRVATRHLTIKAGQLFTAEEAWS